MYQNQINKFKFIYSGVYNYVSQRLIVTTLIDYLKSREISSSPPTIKLSYYNFKLDLNTVQSESDEQNFILESAKCKSARCNKMITRPIECAERKTLVWSYNMKKYYKISNPEIQTCPH